MSLGGTITPTGSVQTAVSTPLWLHWAQIAIDEEAKSLQARRDLLSALQADPTGDWGSASERELHSALVAVTAVVHSLEAFYVGLEPFIKEELRISGKRTRIPVIKEGIKQTYKPKHSMPKWETDFDEVFRLRGDAAHFKEEFRPPPQHPIPNFSPSWVFATWTSELATRATDLLLDILSVAAAGSSNQVDGGHAATKSTLIQQLGDRRRGLRG